MAKKILIIEDEPSLANALRLKLFSVGYDVDVAQNGKIGLDKLKANKYDLVLLDLILPEMDGFEILEAVKIWGVKPPIVVLSNLSQSEDKERVMGLGAIDFFVKSDIELFKFKNFLMLGINPIKINN